MSNDIATLTETIMETVKDLNNAGVLRNETTNEIDGLRTTCEESLADQKTC